MPKIDVKNPRDIWKRYEAGRTYNESINLYAGVETYEKFYAGDQWGNLEVTEIEKPVLNRITRPVNTMVANITSDDAIINLSPSLPSEEDENYLRGVKDEIDRIREQANMQAKRRRAVRNAAVDGDTMAYLYWDTEIKTGQQETGDVVIELHENTRALFGNPNSSDVQTQPYIIIVTRRYIDDVRAEAEANGMSHEDAERTIKADEAGGLGETNTETSLVTRLIYLYRDIESKTIHAVISTANAIIKEDVDTKLRLYPVAWMCWQEARQSYHGVSAVHSIINLQILLNKQLAEQNRCLQFYAWPKVIYNSTVIPKWDNRIGKNIPVNGPVDRAYSQILPGADVSASVMQSMQLLSTGMMDSIGVNDAAMGQLNIDNTSAIIAQQEAATIPLNLQRQAYYEFEEQIVRIILDYLRVNAGVRYVPYSAEKLSDMAEDAIGNALNGGEIPRTLSDPAIANIDMIGTETDPANAPEGTRPIDFSRLNDLAYKLTVDVGSGSMWSEISENNTLEALYRNQIIDGRDLLSSIPRRFIGGKRDTLLKSYDRRQRQMQSPAPEPGGGDIVDRTGATGTSQKTDNAKRYISQLSPEI